MDPIFLSLLTFCLGLFVGHRLTLSRDRRKDFNEVAQPLREILLKERCGPSPNSAGIGKVDADRLESVIPIWKRSSFKKAWEAYCKSKEEIFQDPIGQPFYKNPENIISHIDNVLNYTKRQ
jgi:hypothetical protein